MVSVTGSAFVGGGGGSTTPLPPCTAPELSAENNNDAEAKPSRRRANQSLIIMAVELGYSSHRAAAGKKRRVYCGAGLPAAESRASALRTCGASAPFGDSLR